MQSPSLFVFVKGEDRGTALFPTMVEDRPILTVYEAVGPYSPQERADHSGSLQPFDEDGGQVILLAGPIRESGDGFIEPCDDLRRGEIPRSTNHLL